MAFSWNSHWFRPSFERPACCLSGIRPTNRNGNAAMVIRNMRGFHILSYNVSIYNLYFNFGTSKTAMSLQAVFRSLPCRRAAVRMAYSNNVLDSWAWTSCPGHALYRDLNPKSSLLPTLRTISWYLIPQAIVKRRQSLWCLIENERKYSLGRIYRHNSHQIMLRELSPTKFRVAHSYS